MLRALTPGSSTSSQPSVLLTPGRTAPRVESTHTRPQSDLTMLLQVCLAWGVHDYWFEYIASSVNIADAPSRFVPLPDLPSAYGPVHYLDAIWPPTSELTDPTTAIPRSHH